MGWTSTRDPLEGLRVENGLTFYTKEEAVAFAQKYGWEIEVIENQSSRRQGSVHYRNPRYGSYGDNFTVKRKGLPEGGLRSNLAGGVGSATYFAEPGKPDTASLFAAKGGASSTTTTTATAKATAAKATKKSTKK